MRVYSGHSIMHVMAQACYIHRCSITQLRLVALQDCEVGVADAALHLTVP